MDFVRSKFFTNATLTNCPLFSLFVITFGWVQQQINNKPTQVMTEWKKWAIGQSCIRKEFTSYKIHTLGLKFMTKNQLLLVENKVCHVDRFELMNLLFGHQLVIFYLLKLSIIWKPSKLTIFILCLSKSVLKP